MADYLCVENGLSIITKPKPSRGSYANWQGDERPQSKHIGIYGKTRERYKEYLDSGRDVDFYETFRTGIALHEVAKKHFNGLGYGKNKKLPSIKTLKQEWATLESERKTLYRGYRELKENLS